MEITMYVARQDSAELTCNRCGYAVPWCRIPRLLMCQKSGRVKRPGIPATYIIEAEASPSQVAGRPKRPSV